MRARGELLPHASRHQQLAEGAPARRLHRSDPDRAGDVLRLELPRASPKPAGRERGAGDRGRPLARDPVRDDLDRRHGDRRCRDDGAAPRGRDSRSRGVARVASDVWKAARPVEPVRGKRTERATFMRGKRILVAAVLAGALVSTASAATNDTHNGLQWGLTQVRAETAWATS